MTHEELEALARQGKQPSTDQNGNEATCRRCMPVGRAHKQTRLTEDGNALLLCDACIREEVCASYSWRKIMPKSRDL